VKAPVQERRMLFVIEYVSILYPAKISTPIINALFLIEIVIIFAFFESHEF